CCCFFSFSCNVIILFTILPLSLHDALPISLSGGGRYHDRLYLPAVCGQRDRQHDGGTAAVHGGARRRPDDGARTQLRHAEKHPRDRKSTRLNSSHVSPSYAVFCLKKKTQTYLCLVRRLRSNIFALVRGREKPY